MTLLICPVRNGDQNEELRYALRSWEENLHLGSRLELWTVGYRPRWLKPDMHIPRNEYTSIQFAVFDNIKTASMQAAGINEDVVYMNDDFFCLDPVGSILPVRRNQTLAEHIAVFPENASTWWPKSLRLTASWLAEVGILHPWSYEVHRPLLASPREMYETLARVDLTGLDTVPQWRTLYGAVNGVDAYPVQDCKLGMTNTGFGSPWVSTSDTTWRRYARGITERFRKPSRWE